MWKLFNHYTMIFSFSLGTSASFNLHALWSRLLNVVYACVCYVLLFWVLLFSWYVFLFGWDFCFLCFCWIFFLCRPPPPPHSFPFVMSLWELKSLKVSGLLWMKSTNLVPGRSKLSISYYLSCPLCGAVSVNICAGLALHCLLHYNFCLVICTYS